jgi:hypothetical protein
MLVRDDRLSAVNGQAHESSVCEVRCNTCEGGGAALRTFLRPFRGAHKYYLADYVATFETMANAKRITAAVVQRICFGDRQHTKDSGAAGGAADLLTMARSLMQHWHAGRQ